MDNPERVKNIIKVLDPSKNGQDVLLYTPGTTTLMAEQIRYDGYANSIKLCARLNSLTQIAIPPLDPGADPSQIETKNLALRNSPHKKLTLFLKRLSTGESAEISEVDVWPNQPIFLHELTQFLTTLSVFGIEYGVGLFIRTLTPLGGTDTISFTGSIVERTVIYFDATTNKPVCLI